MTTITLTFDIKPQATERPRFSKFGTYTPKKTKEYKQKLSKFLEELLKTTDLQEKINVLFDKPISLSATFYLEPPKYLIRKNSEPWKVTLPTVKPDVDNLIKGTKDILSKVVFRDDSQVTHEFVRKIYDLRPRVELIIQESNLDFGKPFFTQENEHVYDRPPPH